MVALDAFSGLLWARCLGVCVTMPGVKNFAIPMRWRVGFSFLLACMLGPLVRRDLPASVEAYGQELLYGLVVGFLAQSIVHVVDIVAEIGTQNLTLPQITSGALEYQGSMVGNMAHMLFLVVFFMGDGPYVILHAMTYSYGTVAEGAETLVTYLSRGLRVALELSSPFWMGGLILNFVMGIMNRFVPQLPLFFITQPLNIIFIILTLKYITPFFIKKIVLLWFSLYQL